MGKLEDAFRENLRDTTPKSAPLDTLLFTFAKKKGIIRFAKSILEVGQSLPLDIEFNIEDLISQNVSIKNAVSRLAKSYSNQVDDTERALCDIGGAVENDSMTLYEMGDKY